MRRVKALSRLFHSALKNYSSGHLVQKHLLNQNHFLSRSLSLTRSAMAYQAVERGRLNTQDYRVFISEFYLQVLQVYSQ